jgi:uncharacterized membrane protein
MSRFRMEVISLVGLRSFRKFLWAIMTLSALVVAILNSRFLWTDIRGVFHRAVDHLGTQDFELYLHLSTAPLLLVTGALLFLGGLRERYPAIHRWVGRIYLATVLVTSIATLRLSLHETEGPMTVFGFATLSVLWFATAAMAWLRAVQGRFADHGEWMIRNYVLTLTNVTFRAELHALLWLGADFTTIYEPLRVLQLFPNLVVAEFLIRKNFFTSSSWKQLRIRRQNLQKADEQRRNQ